MKYYQRIIKELREDNDTTQEKIADYLQMTRPQYSLYETGKRELPIDKLIKICMFYGVSADYILGLPKGLKWMR